MAKYFALCYDPIEDDVKIEVAEGNGYEDCFNTLQKRIDENYEGDGFIIEEENFYKLLTKMTSGNWDNIIEV